MERATRYGSCVPVMTIGIAPILIRDQWATHPPVYLQAYHNRIPGAIGSTEAQRSGLVLNRVRLLAASASDRKDSTARYGRRLPRCGISIGPMTAVGHERPKGDVRVESVRLPTADIGRRGP